MSAANLLALGTRFSTCIVFKNNVLGMPCTLQRNLKVNRDGLLSYAANFDMCSLYWQTNAKLCRTRVLLKRLLANLSSLP